MNIQGKEKEKMTYDAIVVGSGISGGWAAKELTEKGLKVLMIERGRDIKHVEGYDTAMKNPLGFSTSRKHGQHGKRTILGKRSHGLYWP